MYMLTWMSAGTEMHIGGDLLYRYCLTEARVH